MVTDSSRPSQPSDLGRPEPEARAEAAGEAGPGPSPVVVRSRGRRIPLWAALGVAVIAGGLIVLLAMAAPATNVSAASPLLGHQAPAVVGPSVLSGETTDLGAERGRWMLVNFFATWCIPCRQEHPEFVSFMQRHQPARDVGLIMVVFNDDPAEVRDWFHIHGGSWPALSDPGGAIALSYGITGVPETYLIDPTGVVVTKIVGGVTAGGLEALLAHAVAVGA
jgi:cytochrome c biogenesis protein CcmG/thiol:disulfide interchange protein DsbE